MKKLIFTTLCFWPVLSFCQHRSESAFKGAKKIIVSDTLSAKSNFKLIGTKLNDLSFYIDKKDDEFMTFVSMPISVEIVGEGLDKYFQTLYIVIKNKEIVITSKSMADRSFKLLGQYQGNATADVDEWKKSDKATAIFGNILKVVKDIPNSKIEYSE